MEPVASADIQVTPTQIVTRGNTLRVKILVKNSSAGTMTLERDKILVHLPSGQTVTRAPGVPYGEGLWGSYYGYGGWVTHEPYVLPPGATHPVDVSFDALGFEWKDVPSAQVDFDGAITRDGQAVFVPPFAVGRLVRAGVVGGPADVVVRH
jgi:hypothetical protein